MTLRQPLALLGTLTAGAAVVGVLRHQLERRRVRAGLQPPLSNAGAVPSPAHEDPLSRALASWVPSRPRSTLGRTVVAVWAAPATAVGLAAAASTGGRWRWDGELGCLVVTGGDAGVNRIQARLGFAANALGHVVITRSATPPPVLLAHEVVHVRQAERLGAALLPLYVWLMARWGYRLHPLERAARLGARRVLIGTAVT